MGWLEDLAKSRGHKSLRAVALAMHKSDHWPRTDKRSSRTVENKLHHVDEGKDASWWFRTGRPFVRALAEVLEEDEDELLIQLQNARPASSGQGSILWPFKMFAGLRPIDFDTEEPFPGVPPSLLRNGGPRELRTWWVAPIGAGKTLVGRWLEARYGWTFIQAKAWADVALPHNGRVFVELSSLAGICVHVLQKIPQTVTICIACPNLPLKKGAEHQNLGYDQDWMFRPNLGREPPLVHDLPSDFAILHTSLVADWGDKLLEWVAHRVTPGGGFNVDQAHELLFHQNLLSLFSTPGDLIGFLGMMDHAGLAQGEEKQSALTMYMRWIGTWLKAASERFVHEHQSAETPELRGKRGAEILCGIEMERLRRGLEPILSDTQWCELIPPGRSAESNRERCAELKEIGVLVEGDAGRWSFKPVWLANAIHAAAMVRLYNDAPHGLGSLLLYKNTSENVLRGMIQEVCSGNFRCIEASLKAGEPSTPEQMVALDGVFRAIGIALLNGVPLNVKWVQQIWLWQTSHTIQRYSNWPPIPILRIAEHGHHEITAHSGWLLAAISITRTLNQAGVDIGSSMLNVWCGLPENAGEYDKCIEMIENAGWLRRNAEENTEPDTIELSAYRLGAALYEKYGILVRHGRVLNLQEPDVLVVLASGKENEISQSELGSVLSLPFGLKALEEACLRQGADCDDVLRWCWRKWGTKTELWQSPAIRWLGRHGSRGKLQDAERLWKVAPDELPETLYTQLATIPEVWPWLNEATWTRWLDVWSVQNGRWSERSEIFGLLPQPLALQAIRDGRVDGHCHYVRDILWRRMPDALLELIDELALLPPNLPRFSGSGGPITWLVYAAPAAQCPPLVQRARLWLAAPSKYPGTTGWIGRWLARVIEQRSPGWRDAYALVVGTKNLLTTSLP